MKRWEVCKSDNKNSDVKSNIVNGEDIFWVNDERGRSVCDLYHTVDDGGMDVHYSKDDAEEHAHLIASAPEMLEALKEAYLILDDITKMDLQKFEAIIARAEGRE